jgi:hypothetical protein
MTWFYQPKAEPPPGAPAAMTSGADLDWLPEFTDLLFDIPPTLEAFAEPPPAGVVMTAGGELDWLPEFTDVLFDVPPTPDWVAEPPPGANVYDPASLDWTPRFVDQHLDAPFPHEQQLAREVGDLHTEDEKWRRPIQWRIGRREKHRF